MAALARKFAIIEGGLVEPRLPVATAPMLPAVDSGDRLAPQIRRRRIGLSAAFLLSLALHAAVIAIGVRTDIFGEARSAGGSDDPLILEGISFVSVDSAAGGAGTPATPTVATPMEASPATPIDAASAPAVDAEAAARAAPDAPAATVASEAPASNPESAPAPTADDATATVADMPAETSEVRASAVPDAPRAETVAPEAARSAETTPAEATAQEPTDIASTVGAPQAVNIAPDAAPSATPAAPSPIVAADATATASPIVDTPSAVADLTPTPSTTTTAPADATPVETATAAKPVLPVTAAAARMTADHRAAVADATPVAAEEVTIDPPAPLPPPKPARTRVAKPKAPPKVAASAPSAPPSAALAAKPAARGPSPGKAGAGGSTDAAGKAAIASYQSSLFSHLNRYRTYPDEARRQGLTGTAVVSFTIDRSGRVVAARLVTGSGAAILDKEAVAMVQRASPFPAIPDALGESRLTVSAPIRFNVR